MKIIKEATHANLDKFFKEYQDKILHEFHKKNRPIYKELEDSLKYFTSESSRIMKSDLSESKAIVIGLNAAFNDPPFFEKLCKEYIEGYFILEKEVKENKDLQYYQEVIDRIDPFESKELV